MKLSVVIPTHNRLHLLKDAVETVRRQSSTDWRIVLFDNASADPIRSFVEGLSDDRIDYHRSDEFLPVTESWNRAIDLADGDYVVLLGDDDGLLPGAIDRLRDIASRFDDPDVIYGNIFQFWHEGVAPWRRAPHVVDVRHGFFFVDRDEPFRLSGEQVRRAVEGSLDFKINFSFNSQAFFYSRAFLKRLAASGPVYRSPFPDYYIANVALVSSASTIIVPKPLAVAGVSKASYGFTMYNDEQDKGDKLLNIKYERDSVYPQIEKDLLPGPTYNTNFVISMEHVSREIKGRIDHSVALKRYRVLQIMAVMRHISGRTSRSDLWTKMKARLTARERVLAAALRAFLALTRRPRRLRRLVDRKLDRMGSMTGFEPMPRMSDDLDCKTMTDVYEAFESGRLV